MNYLRLSVIICVLAAFILSGCKSNSNESVRHFHLHGRVVSVHTSQGFIEVGQDAVPGYMEAMTMPYPVPDARTVASLAPGDEITADLVVTDQGPHLENVVVVKKSSQPPAPSTSRFHMPKPGDAVPDFVLTDQNGRPVHLRTFRGDVLLLTFIYTRCPFADFCPRVSDSFAKIYAALVKQPALASKLRLLSVSFDPTHDTPRVLRAYAASFHDVTGTARPFDHWEFAVAPQKELPAIANFFGLYYNAEQGQIIHSMSTSLISPDGKILEWFHNNDWQPSDLVADASRALAAEQHARTLKRTHVSGN